MLDPLITFALYMFLVSILISLVRLVRGPSLPDRVIAADTINGMIIVLIVLIGILQKNDMFLDVAVVYALISFIANLSISKYLMGMRLHE